MGEVFTLSWDDFTNKCPKVFKELWLDTDLSDVTLATEDGGQLTAHKVILAACSPLFKRLLQKNQNSHPLLYLMGVQLSQLQQLLRYIYLGQCELTQEQLPIFVATGKQLEVEGLLGDLEEEKKLEASADVKIEFDTQILEITNQVDEIAVTTERNIQESNADKEQETTSVVAEYGLDCQQCDYKASYHSHMRQHVQNVHEGVKYDCANCDYKNGDKSNLKRHIEKAHLGVTYTCELCLRVFN